MTEAAADRNPDRRHFAGLLLAGAAASCTGVAVAQPPAADPSAKPAPLPAADDIPDATAEELVLELVRRTDPERLKPEHLAVLRDEIRSNFFRSKTLRSFLLENGDGPAVVFRPLPPAAAP